ncbi:MAG: hypothetical protein M1822_005406 [Bathelium mastoideum]|nr:MAG: hypothetical protein M1822_005406 [Bathelium mastoideum]
MLLLWYCLLLVLASAQAATPSPSFDINRYPPQPQETACGDIVNANLYDGQVLFNASDVFDCLTSVPFSSAVALRFLQYLNQTFQFHATTAFVRDPPPGYQQAPFDFLGALEDKTSRVYAGAYHNQYAFESDVQAIIRNLHDTHAYVYGGISGPFSFLSPFRLVSLSLDGKQVPKLYVYDDLIDQVTHSITNASAIVTVNGMAANDYVSSFASQQSFGMLEPHADWNQVMTSPAQEIFGLNSFSEAAPFYAGDQMNLVFENGSTAQNRWLALFGSPGFTGPLETGGDFYNFFVLGLYPANFNATFAAYYSNSNLSSGNPTLDADDGDDDTEPQTSWCKDSPAYPCDTMTYQKDLGQFSNGALTGYFLENISTAVLSLPSFEQYADSIDTFSQAVIDFVGNATKRHAKTVIVDLQQNAGGEVSLAFWLFDKFFPNTRPFAGSRMRSHQDANIVGDTFTSHFQTLPVDPSNETFQDYQGSEWVVTDRINALTGDNFTSWAQYYGPHYYNGDNFTLVQQYDLSNPLFVEAALDIQLDSCFYNRSCSESRPWNSTDIVILTDGICGSTCSLFVEMMREEGVRTVTIGGRPEHAPMQAASGSRGAASYSDDELYYDFEVASESSTAAAASLPLVPPDTGIQGVFAGFTLRDQIQRNYTVPNQVLYMPADCRLFWTFTNFYNYTHLWQDVYEAVFTEPSSCVPGSRNATAPPTATHPTEPAEDKTALYILHGLSTDEIPTNETFEGMDFPIVWDGRPPPVLQICDYNRKSHDQCDRSGFECYKVKFGCLSCGEGACSSPITFGVCSKACYNGDDSSCDGFSQCLETGPIPSRTQSVSYGGRSLTKGYCVPVWSYQNQRTSCNRINGSNVADMIQGNWGDWGS